MQPITDGDVVVWKVILDSWEISFAKVGVASTLLNGQMSDAMRGAGAMPSPDEVLALAILRRREVENRVRVDGFIERMR